MVFSMTSLKHSWRITTKHLKEAHALLPKDLYFEEAKAFNNDFLEYIEHNELELALNSLDDLGILCNASNQFWRQLELAALNMELTSDAERFNKIQNT